MGKNAYTKGRDTPKEFELVASDAATLQANCLECSQMLQTATASFIASVPVDDDEGDNVKFTYADRVGMAKSVASAYSFVYDEKNAYLLLALPVGAGLPHGQRKLYYKWLSQQYGYGHKAAHNAAFKFN
eukprot:COSAG01_NODE_23748_length_803_cov_1.075284_1_plen_128_part_10